MTPVSPTTQLRIDTLTKVTDINKEPQKLCYARIFNTKFV